MIPLVDLATQHRRLMPELQAALERIAGKASFILGEEVEAFERDFAAFAGARHGVGVATGTDALALALRAIGVGPGDEVIVPAMTFVATALAVCQAGATPVLVDVEEGSGLLSPEVAARAITSRTKVILPVHLYGRRLPMEGFLKLGPKVVEDACQAHGAVLLQGVLAAYSFYPGKNLGALGDGGAVVTNDASLAARLRKLREYGQSVKYRHEEMGTNSRLDALQAAFLRIKLAKLPEWNRRRAELAREYDRVLAGAPVTRPEIVRDHVWHLYVVRSRRRDELKNFLESRGIHAGIHYPIPLHLQPCFGSLGYPAGRFPHAERLADEVLSLPLYPEMTAEQVGEVARAIHEFH